MNEIKIYLKSSGSTAELYKDFNLYQGSYRNVQITIYVPSEIMYANADNTYFNTVQTGAIMTAPNGAKVVTKSNNAAFVKTEVLDGVEYAVYSQVMPKEYALYAGTQLIVCNVVSVDNTDETHPQIISVTTSQRASLTVLESAYLSDGELLDPTESEVIEGLINNLQQRLNKGEFAARAIYAWNSTYTYGAGELVFYPQKGEYGVFLKSLTDNNKAEPYVNGALDTANWLLVSDFNILTELYSLKGDIANSATIAAQNAQSAVQSANAAASSSQQAAQSVIAAENAAKRIENQTQYLEGIKEGTVAVPKAMGDGTGNNIADQFAVVNSDIAGLREDISNEAHFRGMFDSVEDLRAQYPTATPNDYAYIVGGNIWIYGSNGWTDSDKPSPNTTVPASSAIPFMDGTGAAGVSSKYSRGDHRHPSDTTKANTVDLTNEVANRKNADIALTESSNKNLYNLGVYDTYVSNGDGTATITRKTGYASIFSDNVDVESADLNLFRIRYQILNGAKSHSSNEIITTATVSSYTSNAFYGNAALSGLAVDNNNTVFIRVTNVATLAEMQSYLAENPILIQYELAPEYQYTETVIENQPIHTLNQDGEQWVREEWKKGLNLFSANINETNKGISVSANNSVLTLNGKNTATEESTIIKSIVLPAGVYTASCWYNSGSATANFRIVIHPTDWSWQTTLNLDGTNGDVKFSSDGNKNIEFQVYLPAINNNANNLQYGIMLNKGTVTYPYQPYHGEIIRESGGTMTGELHLPGLYIERQSAIEMGAAVASPYIDFHYDGDPGDFTSRIIEEVKGKLNVVAELQEYGQRVYSPNNKPSLNTLGIRYGRRAINGNYVSLNHGLGRVPDTILVSLEEPSNKGINYYIEYYDSTYLTVQFFSSGTAGAQSITGYLYWMVM